MNEHQHDRQHEDLRPDERGGISAELGLVHMSEVSINCSTDAFAKLVHRLGGHTHLHVHEHCHHHRPNRKSLRLIVTARLPGGTTVTGDNMEITTSVNNEIPFTLDPEDFQGHETRIDGTPSFTFDSEGTEVVADPNFTAPSDHPKMLGFIARPVNPDADDSALNVATKITASVDADLTEGVTNVSIDVLTVTWTPRVTEAIGVAVGDPRTRT